MELRARSFLTRRDLPFFALVLAGLAVVLALVYTARPGRTATLLVDGEPAAVRELGQIAEREELTVTGQSGIAVTVEFAPGEARVVASDCPDKTCVRTGPLTRAGETAVCLPARVVLRIDGETTADAETF